MKYTTRNVKKRETLARYIQDAYDSGIKYWSFGGYTTNSSELRITTADEIVTLYINNSNAEEELRELSTEFLNKEALLNTWLRKNKLTNLGF